MSRLLSFLFYVFIFSNISISIPAKSKLAPEKKYASNLKKMALDKKPKSLFLLKKTTEDLDVEEPNIDLLTRQTTAVINDKRFDKMD